MRFGPDRFSLPGLLLYGMMAPETKPASAAVPTAPGYNFEGWYIKSDNSENALKYRVFNSDGTRNDAG